MTIRIKKILCLCVATILLCGLCACGEEEVRDGGANPTIPADQFTPEQGYHLNKNDKGVYDYQLVDRLGQVVYAQSGLKYMPTFTAVNDSLLQVMTKTGSSPSAQQALFYNVKSGQVSTMFGGFLAATETHVAYVTYLTNQYHVFVAAIFDPQIPVSSVTLEGLTIEEELDPITSYTTKEDGTLEVTYPTKKGNKTVTVTLP